MLQPAVWIFVADWTIRLVLSVHVIIRRRSIGMSLAWLLIILLLPFVGTIIYLLLGDNRLGRYRARWAARMRKQYEPWKSRLGAYVFEGWDSLHTDPAQLSRMILSATDAVPLMGNRIQLLHSGEAIFAAMIADINQARISCHLEVYIWEVGGLADEMCDSLAAAAQRGVECRLLVDAVGSRGFLASRQARELRSAGVEIHAALPVNLLRALLYRFDLRLHRKIVIIDHAIGYVGSQNVADPKIFRRGAGFGQWVDAMVRMNGPAVDALAMVVFEDWHFETTRSLNSRDLKLEPPVPLPCGQTIVQVVPSGPGIDSEAIMQILVNAIYMADTELTITTPYFIPDESLQRALISAARRGVRVTIVIPKHIDSRLVRWAGRPFLRELAEVGVAIARYHKGMLHTKSITVDHDTSFFGSLNLDPRSLHLNFEIMLALYDPEFTSQLQQLQREYIAQSEIESVADLMTHSFGLRFLESCARLISPLL